MNLLRVVLLSGPALGSLIPRQAVNISSALEDVASSLDEFCDSASKFLVNDTTYSDWYDRGRLEFEESKLYATFARNIALIGEMLELEDTQEAVQPIVPSFVQLKEAVQREAIIFQWYNTPVQLEAKEWHAVEILREQYHLFGKLIRATIEKVPASYLLADYEFAIQNFLYATLAYLQPCSSTEGLVLKSSDTVSDKLAPRQANVLKDTIDTLAFTIHSYAYELIDFLQANFTWDKYENFTALLNSETDGWHNYTQASEVANVTDHMTDVQVQELVPSVLGYRNAVLQEVLVLQNYAGNVYSGDYRDHAVQVLEYQRNESMSLFLALFTATGSVDLLNSDEHTVVDMFLGSAISALSPCEGGLGP